MAHQVLICVTQERYAKELGDPVVRWDSTRSSQPGNLALFYLKAPQMQIEAVGIQISEPERRRGNPEWTDRKKVWWADYGDVKRFESPIHKSDIDRSKGLGDFSTFFFRRTQLVENTHVLPLLNLVVRRNPWVRAYLTNHGFKLETKRGLVQQPEFRDHYPKQSKHLATRTDCNPAIRDYLMRLHDNRCQVCGVQIQLPDEKFYLEGHHIVPRAEGVDHPRNVLVLCPNHHLEFDRLALTVRPGSRGVLVHCDPNNRYHGRRLRCHPIHKLGRSCLEHHWHRFHGE